MKICVKCKKNQARGPAKSRPSGYSYCKSCFRSLHVDWVINNPDKVRSFNKKAYLKNQERRLVEAAAYRQNNTEAIRTAASLSRAKKRLIIDELKTRTPCADCGGMFPPVAMDFDHVRGVKRFNIAKIGGTGMSTKVLFDEIAKCELVCANCHRVRTQKRGQGWHGRKPTKEIAKEFDSGVSKL